MKPENQNAEFDIQKLEEVYLDQWQSGDQRPQLDEFLVDLSVEQRRQALNVLLPIDVQYRFQAGEELQSDSYSDIGDDAVAIVAELFDDESVERQHEINTKRGSTAEDDFFRNSQGWGNSVSEDVPKELVAERYRLINKIGQGGMGTVWLAQQEHPMRRRVAIKIIGKSLASKESHQRFAAERQALALMDHPNIAKVLDAGVTNDDRPFIAMELVKGIPITDFCNNHNLSIKKRLELMTQVCAAVQHAHQKGIIHRDLKPSNILISFHEGQPIVKVIDFGLAKALEHSARLTDNTFVTEIGRVVGTLQYMSPEQANSNELDIDTRTDVYSLGVILYQLLVEILPLEKESLVGKSLIDIAKIISELKVVPPSQKILANDQDSQLVCEQRSTDPSRLIRILEGELDWIVLKTLQRNRIERYPTADSLKEDLQRFLNNEPVSARPPSRTYLLKKFVQKNRSLVASLATIAAVLIAATTVSSLALVTAKESENEARAAETEARDAESRAKKQFQVFLESFKRTNVLTGASKDMSAIDLLKIAQTDLESGLEDDPVWLAELLYEVGVVFRGHARFDESIDALQKSHDLRLTHLGAEDFETNFTAVALSKTEMEQWRRSKAKNADEMVASLDRMQLATENLINLVDEDDPEVAELTGDLGTGYFLAYKELKKIDDVRPEFIEKSIRLLSDSERKKEEQLGEFHESTISTLTNLANAYLRTGDLEKSIEYNKRSVKNWGKLYDASLIETNDDSSAESRSRQDTRRILGRLARARNNYAEAIHQKGVATDDKKMIDEAIAQYRLALQEKETVVAVGHDMWFNTVRWLAKCYLDAGNKSELEAFQAETLAKIQDSDLVQDSHKEGLVERVNDLFKPINQTN